MPLLNRLVVSTLPFVPKSLVGLVSRRYIAGTSLEHAVVHMRLLNAKGFSTTTDLLGEYITRLDEAETNAATIGTVLRTIDEAKLRSTVSVKPSQLGLLLDRDACYRNMRALAERAQALGNRLTMDMEDSSTVDATWDLYYRLRSDGFTNVGMVAQAYLRRVEEDVRKLVRNGGGEVRLCKGIYIEPEAIAFRDRDDVRRNYLKVLEILMENGCYAGIATHDDVLVDGAFECIARAGLKPDGYEFQMLLGVREALRDAIVKKGHHLRVYVPFGEHWYAYSVRRLRENPQVAGYVFRAMFDRFRAA